MAEPGSHPTNSQSRVISLVGAILISVACFSLVFWGVAHITPWLLHFSQSRWSGMLPAISVLFIALGGWMRHRRQLHD